MQEKIKLAARDLRKKLTETEDILWKRLRNRGFLGIKFLRQHPIVFKIDEKERFFIADFYCREKRLVVEIDGKIHLKQKEYDQYRNLIIQELGLRVIRVKNKTIENELDKFLHDVLTPILADSTSNSPPAPLFQKERGVENEFENDHQTQQSLSLCRREGSACSPSLREEKVRIAMPRLCEAFGDATPQREGSRG